MKSATGLNMHQGSLKKCCVESIRDDSASGRGCRKHQKRLERGTEESVESIKDDLTGSKRIGGVAESIKSKTT